MKYIVSLIFTLVLLPGALASNIDVSSDKSSYDIDENVRLLIEIDGSNNGDAQLEIAGIEQNFQVIGQSQSQNTQIINGESSSQVFINLSLLAYKSGEYSLGPITLEYNNGEALVSNKISIEITGERITINPNISTPPISNTETLQPQDLTKIDLSSSSAGQVKEVLGIDGIPMEDVYNIKAKLFPSLFYPITLLLAGVVSLCVYIGGYIIYKHGEHNIIKTRQDKKTNYLKILKDIKKQHLNSSKEVFYSHIGYIFREYLDETIEHGLSGKSLHEAQSILPKSLHSLYSKIYFPAYNNTPDNIENRKKIFTKLEILFTKK